MKKKLLTSLLVASLVLVSTAPVVHATETQGTITINSTQKNATYNAYKIFDATISDSTADGQGVSYTVPVGKEDEYKRNEALLELFDLTSNGDRVYVTRKENVTDLQIAEFAKTFVEVTRAQSVASTVENNGDGVESLTVPYGYYFVGTTVAGGATVMVTSASPNAIIQEKNNEPGWGEDGAKKIDSATKTYAVGEKITYTLEYNNATYYSKGKKVYQYVVKDTLGEGIKFNQDSIEVYVNDKKLTANPTGNAVDTYKVVPSETGFEITIPWAATQEATSASKLGNEDDFFYKKPISKITVKYTGILKSAATEGSVANEKNKNKATINPNTEETDTGKEVYVYDGEITIKKVDGKTTTKPLKGAKFVLKKQNGKFMKFDRASDKWLEVSDQAQAEVYETDDQGSAKISGLATGEYELIEIEAPKGYNLKKDPTPVSLKFDENTGDGNDTLLATPQIENNQGAELPSTGGLGTTIFYAIGASLMIGSGVVLVARRRLRD